MKIFNKFVESKKEPSNTSDIWFDGSKWNIYKNEEWKPFTISLEKAQALYNYVKDSKLFKIVKELPLVGNDTTIYLLENKNSIEGNTLVEYIYINNSWEEIGNFTPTLELENYLKIEDSPFEKGSAENSAVLKGGDNQATADYAFAQGTTTQASGYASHAEGELTVAKGKHSHAEGWKTIANSVQSHAEGAHSKANGQYSHAEGYNTVASGEASHSSGYETQSYNKGEFAAGIWNDSRPGTQFSVGIGDSKHQRKNAHEILNTGEHYIYGIGGYDGTNPSDAKDVATYVKSLETRIIELESIISQITIKVE